MKKSIAYSDDRRLSLIDAVPDCIYKLVKNSYPPESRLSDNTFLGLQKLLTNPLMTPVWQTLHRAAVQSHEKMTATPTDEFLNATFSLFMRLYRGHLKTGVPKTIKIDGKVITFQNSKHRQKIEDRSKELLDLLQAYPYASELYFRNPLLSNLERQLSSLHLSIKEFKPKTLSLFVELGGVKISRKRHGPDGRLSIFINQCASGLSDLYGKPMNSVVAVVITVLFPESESPITSRDVRVRTSFSKK